MCVYAELSDALNQRSLLVPLGFLSGREKGLFPLEVMHQQQAAAKKAHTCTSDRKPQTHT